MAILLLWIGVAASICYWGNREFLLREFSRNASKEISLWQQFFSTRVWLLLPAIALLGFVEFSSASIVSLSIFLIARFIYQSYDPIIVYRRKFAWSIAAETISFVFISAFAIFTSALSEQKLLIIFMTAEILKAIFITICFRKEFSPFRFKKPAFTALKSAVIFFLLGFSGLLASRSDLMCVSLFLPEAEIARYQVYVNFLLLASGVAMVILQPFIKNIYRIRQSLVRKWSLKLFLCGILIAPVIMLMIFLAVSIIYNFQLTFFQVLMGTLFIIPNFGYSVIIYNLFRNNRQNVVIIVSLVAAGFIYVLTFVLMKTISVSLNNGLIAITSSNWIILIIYLLTNSRQKHAVI